jgi:hypothetical protein
MLLEFGRINCQVFHQSCNYLEFFYCIYSRLFTSDLQLLINDLSLDSMLRKYSELSLLMPNVVREFHGKSREI